jgi:hypothetical protein
VGLARRFCYERCGDGASVATLANVTGHSSADVLLSYVRTADLIADLAMLHNERRWPPRSGATPMSNFGLYYVVIGPAAMLAIGAIVFWLITRLPD